MGTTCLELSLSSEVWRERALEFTPDFYSYLYFKVETLFFNPTLQQEYTLYVIHQAELSSSRIPVNECPYYLVEHACYVLCSVLCRFYSQIRFTEKVRSSPQTYNKYTHTHTTTKSGKYV